MKTFKQNLYNPSNLNKFNEVDSEIPEELVESIKNSLDNIKDNFRSTIPVIVENKNVYFKIIYEEDSFSRYLIKIEKI
jgi:hypothetical protein